MQSCLDAAYARYRFVKEMVAQFPSLKTVTITDAKREGRISMAEDEIRDLKESLKEEEEKECERVVPELLLKMWHTPLLELPVAECTWEEATLIVIGSMDGHGRWCRWQRRRTTAAVVDSTVMRKRRRCLRRWREITILNMIIHHT